MTHVTVLTALADPTRRQVFERLADAPASVAEITRGLPVSQPAVSQHLKVLREAGLVVGTPRGASTIYRIDPAGLAPLRHWLDRYDDAPLQAPQRAVEPGRS